MRTTQTWTTIRRLTSNPRWTHATLNWQVNVCDGYDGEHETRTYCQDTFRDARRAEGRPEMGGQATAPRRPPRARASDLAGVRGTVSAPRYCTPHTIAG